MFSPIFIAQLNARGLTRELKCDFDYFGSERIKLIEA